MKDVLSWGDITVGQYQEMMMVQSDSEITKFIECIAIALDIDPQSIREMPYKDYSQLQQKMSFISQEPLQEVKTIIEIDGTKYGLEPDMSLITAGVFIDAEQFKQEPIENLHNTLALIYRPIIEEEENGEYKIEQHKAQGFEKRANLFKDKISIEVVLGATLFFSLLGIELSILSLEFLSNQMETELVQTKTMMTQATTKKRKKKRSTKDTGSTTLSSNSQTEI
jgi:hypothetical protein